LLLLVLLVLSLLPAAAPVLSSVLWDGRVCWS
jgi:hypothetical protein